MYDITVRVLLQTDQERHMLEDVGRGVQRSVSGLRGIDGVIGPQCSQLIIIKRIYDLVIVWSPGKLSMSQSVSQHLKTQNTRFIELNLQLYYIVIILILPIKYTGILLLIQSQVGRNVLVNVFSTPYPINNKTTNFHHELS